MESSTYPLGELFLRWARGDLTVQQLAGHLLQHLIAFDKRLRALENASNHPPQES